ncbi:hypothetical protein F5878DRAFT_663711, partial [Lentinula raphanica]
MSHIPRATLDAGLYHLEFEEPDDPGWFTAVPPSSGRKHCDSTMTTGHFESAYASFSSSTMATEPVFTKAGEVLQIAAGNDIRAIPTAENTTAWPIPFDMIVSSIPRLQPRYYSISSSPKLHPNSIHVTCVVLKYQSSPNDRVPERWVYGVGSNFLLNLKHAANGEETPLISDSGVANTVVPTYAIEGPRGAYRQENIYKAPIHVRRSTFRLPTNPKSPVIMGWPRNGSSWTVIVMGGK